MPHAPASCGIMLTDGQLGYLDVCLPRYPTSRYPNKMVVWRLPSRMESFWVWKSISRVGIRLLTVCVGADSRTTTGSYIANRVTDKLTRVHDTIWCCRSGSAADTQAVADIVQYQLGLFAMQNGKPPMTQTAASIFQEICYSNKDRLS